MNQEAEPASICFAKRNKAHSNPHYVPGISNEAQIDLIKFS